MLNRPRLKTLSGAYFRGRISPAPQKESTSQNSGWFIPRRLLTVDPECHITTGTIILDHRGRKMLTSWEGEDGNTTVYRLHDLDQYVSWKRTVTTVDPVTQLPKGASEQELGPIWCAIELYGQQSEGALNTVVNRYLVLTNANLLKNDRVNGLTVNSVNRTLGVTIAVVW